MFTKKYNYYDVENGSSCKGYRTKSVAVNADGTS